MTIPASQWLIALKKALPDIGRTETKVIVALIGMPRPISYLDISKLIGQKPGHCVYILEQSGFIIRASDDISFALNPPDQWKPTEVKRIRAELTAADPAHILKLEKDKLKRIEHQAYMRRQAEKKASKKKVVAEVVP